jgi:hypothetical protein
VLSFDPPNWDYTLESDKVPSLVPYSSYADAPIRHREYSYIRGSLKKFIFRYQYLVEIYSVSAEKIISDAFSYSENI